MGWTSFFSGHNQRVAAAEANNRLNAGKQEAYGFLNPWSQAGGQALAPLTGLLTGTSYDYKTGQQTQLNQDQRQDLFHTSPGYQFRMDQAMKAIQGGQAAQGNLLSGGAQKELTQYSQGVAGDEYGNYLNQLFQLSGMGEQADAAKANVATGMAVPLAQSAFSSGIAADVGADRLMNTVGSAAGGIAGLLKAKMGANALTANGGGGGVGANPATIDSGGGGSSWFSSLFGGK